MNSRQLSAYEKSHLVKYGFDPEKFDLTDDTPVEYVTGYVKFRDLEFKVSPAVLIPRVETEELVELILHDIPHLHLTQPLILADVGTGSGAISLSLADALLRNSIPFHMYASDISNEALQVATDNYQRLVPRAAVTFLQSDLLKSYAEHQQLDIIVANLPYIPTTRLNQLEASVKDFEPWLALDGGDLGIELIQQLVHEVETKLKPHGVLWLEIDHTHTQELLDPEHTFDVSFFSDSFGHQRFVRMKRK